MVLGIYPRITPTAALTGGSKKKNSEATSSRTKQGINIRGTNLQDIGTKGSRRRRVMVMVMVMVVMIKEVGSHLSANLHSIQSASQILRRKRQSHPLVLTPWRHGIRRGWRHSADDRRGIPNRLLEQGDRILGKLVRTDGMIFREKRHHGTGVTLGTGVDDSG
jgi:hypothetical protein